MPFPKFSPRRCEIDDEQQAENAAAYARLRRSPDYHDWSLTILARLDRIAACAHVWPGDDLPQVCEVCGGIRVGGAR